MYVNININQCLWQGNPVLFLIFRLSFKETCLFTCCMVICNCLYFWWSYLYLMEKTMAFKWVGLDARSRAPILELIVIYKAKPVWDVCPYCVINQNIFLSMNFLCFGRTSPFHINPTHSFINDIPSSFFTGR